MHKLEIFLPLPGMAKAMDEYFTKPSVFYLDGLPTQPSLPSSRLSSLSPWPGQSDSDPSPICSPA